MDLRDFFEGLVYETGGNRRYLQESPVMPDVWIRYGLEPGIQQELLMVPDWKHTTADLSACLKDRLRQEGEPPGPFRNPEVEPRPAAVAHNQHTVVATLWFDQLIRIVLPLSPWWRDAVVGLGGGGRVDRLADAMQRPEALMGAFVAGWAGGGEGGEIPPDALWMGKVVGLLAYISTPEGRDLLVGLGEEDTVATLRALAGDPQEHPKLARALIALLEGMDPVHAEDMYPLFTVNRNRETAEALHDSVATVKADATQRVFQVGGRDIRWAIIDSGVDATHVAFRRRDEKGRPRAQPFGRSTGGRRRRRRQPQGESRFRGNTRVVSTYDFVHIRELLSTRPGAVDQLDADRFPVLREEGMRERLAEVLARHTDQTVDWEALDPFIRVPHTPKGYRPPSHPHGTHVAGIIAADWREADEEAGLPGPLSAHGGDLWGVCPEIEILDLRVLDGEGVGDEFGITSAMQFVRDLNARKDFVAVHGVNLSLAIEHDVANYACGRTPVCEEAERLAANGTVVVAAAGNSGRARYLTPSGLSDDGFRTVSITDPGNAESVITVGATHRRDPHMYGVSYFSSRGPTGDGRLKPDLVAPGEKIRSTVPGNSDARMDGTSMAAPHVSGAAALILSRHTEFIGQAQRVKAILCESATDLGRERYFQGSGLLDILRALQSV